MSLQTYEEEEILRRIRELDHRVRRIEENLSALTALSEAILARLPPTYHAPAGMSFVASPHAAVTGSGGQS